jgi:hypothetical protein
MPEVMKWREVAFHCPKECGGTVSVGVRFFVTGDGEIVVCGTCSECGASGMKSISITDLLMNAPIGAIN